jgi:hypothetical protein
VDSFEAPWETQLCYAEFVTGDVASYVSTMANCRVKAPAHPKPEFFSQTVKPQTPTQGDLT